MTNLAAGDVIPSEAQLGAAFQVSRLTVGQALYELRAEGFSLGKIWLFTVGEKPAPPSQGSRIAQIGPLPLKPG